jgi:3-dehydroquinate dehydratase/shikimate dehydrogenase
MGPLGTLTRILGGRTGAPFTYACPEAGSEAAPGQIPASLLSRLYRVREITSATKVYGILGVDVLGSLSPAIHNRAFAARGKDAVYVPLQAESLPAFLEALPHLGLSGFSVTRPYKVEIVEHLLSISEEAAAAGSVNTVSVSSDGLNGSSTDGRGVIQPLQVFGSVSGQNIALIGAGGAARAAAAALKAQGAGVTVLARDPEKATKVARTIGCGSADLRAFPAGSWDVVVNATPVGSRSFGESLPIPADSLKPEMTVFDMVYDPLETPLLGAARELGCTTIDGLRMLVAQAVGQFETWTGEKAPIEVMEAAARSAAAGRPV